MDFLSDLWGQVTGVFQTALSLIHGVFEPIFGDEPAWGWAIIALTLLVRVVLLPLAVRQSRSMRAMQELQPRIKKIQAKYPADRALMQKDPELYKKRKQEQNEQLMALYQDEGVNPASSCLPLLAQAPIFFALFSVLRGFDELRDADFYWITSAVSEGADGLGLGALVSQAGWPGWVLIVAMVVSMFITQRQTMARSTVEGPAAQQQKIILYVMPAFLAFISRGLPLGVILYWVTTNIWQGVQQWIIFRDQNAAPDEAAAASPRPASGKAKVEDADGPTKSTTKSTTKSRSDRSPAERPSKGSQRATSDHLPRRGKSGGSSTHLPGGKD